MFASKGLARQDFHARYVPKQSWENGDIFSVGRRAVCSGNRRRINTGGAKPSLRLACVFCVLGPHDDAQRILPRAVPGSLATIP